MKSLASPWEFRSNGCQKINATRTILLELTHLLGMYLDGIVLIGGWIPLLRFPDTKPGLIGNMNEIFIRVTDIAPFF
ncbi:MAG: hypothetical protein GYA26_06955 [Flexilinea flocculi]|nr:hypothetical protein [Flexilinea flocculi]